MTKEEYLGITKQDLPTRALFPGCKKKKALQKYFSFRRLNSDHYKLEPVVGVRHWDDEHKKLQALILRDWLSPEAALGQQAIALVYSVLEAGLNKGCASSGLITVRSINTALNDLYAMSNYGVERHRVLYIKITSTCGSARLVYQNSEGQRKEFQFGRYLDFHLTNKEGILKWVSSLEFTKDYLAYVEAYFHETETILEQLAPYFMTTTGRQAFAKHTNCLNELRVGMNLCTHCASTISCHEDNASAIPALVTCTNAAGHNASWTHGSLYLAEGGIKIPYGPRDVVLINGNRLHGVTMLHPDHKQKECSRFSLVQFLRSSDYSNFQAHNLTSTKSISAPSKKRKSRK